MVTRDGGTGTKVLQACPKRRSRVRMWSWLSVCVALCHCLGVGCFSPAVNQPNADLTQILEHEEAPTRDVGDLARPVGTNFVKIESPALVANLDGTGSDPPPSMLRELLMADMKARSTRNPNAVLASPATALVHVVAYLPPGVQKGDRTDLFVSTPRKSGATSLQGGWLLETRLTEIAMLGGRPHDGHVRAIGEGPVLIDAAVEGSDDAVLLTRGRIPGGARVLASRSLGLVIRSGQKSARTSSRIGKAINARFHIFDEAGIKQGVATPKTDEFIELKIHPRYRSNIARYIQVIRSIPVRETADERIERLVQLEQELQSPATASRAALTLEALGEEGIPVLANGLSSEDALVRFYAAEALAYLDDNRAIAPLADAARNEPAFRWHALTALSVMDDLQVFDEIETLLHLDSAETRYGAFRALLSRGPTAPAVKGEAMRGGYSYHIVDTHGEPMIHLSRTRRPEIVLFGKEERFKTPFVLFCGKEFIIKGLPGDKVRVSCFLPGKDERVEECSARVDDVIRAVDKLGGSYAHVIQILREARTKQTLTCRVVLDAGPKPGRQYVPDDPAQAPNAENIAESPLPELFFSAAPEDAADGADADPSEPQSDISELGADKAQSGGGFFDTMKSWMSP